LLICLPLEEERVPDFSKERSPAPEPSIEQPLAEPAQPPRLFSWQVAVMLVIIVVAWATPNVIGRYLAVKSALTPLQISALRYLPASLTLLIYCLLSRKSKTLFITLKTHWLHLLVASVILTSFVILQMYSVTLTNASASSFLLNINPVVTFLLSLVILKEHHRWWGGVGVVIASCGIFFIAVPIENLTLVFNREVLLGNLLAFLSGVMWAFYSVYLKRFLKTENPIVVTTWNLSFSATILLIAMFAVDGWFSSPPAYYHIILTVFMGIVPTAIAFTLWFETIRRIPVQKASVFQFLIPIIATLFALTMGETIDWFFALGGVLILGGLLLTQFA